MFETIRRRIEVSQRRKQIREDLDPTYLTIALCGLVMFWLDNREHFSHRFGPEMNDKDYLRQAIEILERGMSLTDAPTPDEPTATDEPSDEAGE
jgi:TetR/AcrR family transcriptional regulator